MARLLTKRPTLRSLIATGSRPSKVGLLEAQLDNGTESHPNPSPERQCCANGQVTLTFDFGQFAGDKPIDLR